MLHSFIFLITLWFNTVQNLCFSRVLCKLCLCLIYFNSTYVCTCFYWSQYPPSISYLNINTLVWSSAFTEAIVSVTYVLCNLINSWLLNNQEGRNFTNWHVAMMASSYNTTLKFSELFQTKHSVVWFEGCLARCLIFLQLWQRDCQHLGLKISRCGPVVLPIWCMFGLKSVDTNHLFKLKARRGFFFFYL